MFVAEPTAPPRQPVEQAGPPPGLPRGLQRHAHARDGRPGPHFPLLRREPEDHQDRRRADAKDARRPRLTRPPPMNSPDRQPQSRLHGRARDGGAPAPVAAWSLSHPPMNLSLYSAATGMEAQELNLNTIANNLANVNTPGLQEEQDRVPGPALHQAPRSRARTPATATWSHRASRWATAPGSPPHPRCSPRARSRQTGQQLDLAIQGDGFFEVQQPDGTIAYTRDGSFKLNAQGQVVTADGLPVLSGFQSIPRGRRRSTSPRPGNVSVTRDRTAPRPSSSPSPASPIEPGLQSLGGNLYAETAGERRAPDRAARAKTATAPPCRGTSRARTSTSSRRW